MTETYQDGNALAGPLGDVLTLQNLLLVFAG